VKLNGKFFTERCVPATFCLANKGLVKSTHVDIILGQCNVDIVFCHVLYICYFRGDGGGSTFLRNLESSNTINCHFFPKLVYKCVFFFINLLFSYVFCGYKWQRTPIRRRACIYFYNCLNVLHMMLLSTEEKSEENFSFFILSAFSIIYNDATSTLFTV